MQDLTTWLLTNILSPLLLPIFLIAILCSIAGARPESVIGDLLRLISEILKQTFQLLSVIVSACLGRQLSSRRPPGRK